MDTTLRIPSERLTDMLARRTAPEAPAVRDRQAAAPPRRSRVAAILGIGGPSAMAAAPSASAPKTQDGAQDEDANATDIAELKEDVKALAEAVAGIAAMMQPDDDPGAMDESDEDPSAETIEGEDDGLGDGMTPSAEDGADDPEAAVRAAVPHASDAAVRAYLADGLTPSQAAAAYARESTSRGIGALGSNKPARGSRGQHPSAGRGPAAQFAANVQRRAVAICTNDGLPMAKSERKALALCKQDDPEGFAAYLEDKRNGVRRASAGVLG